jgi:hypothetical protein
MDFPLHEFPHGIAAWAKPSGGIDKRIKSAFLNSIIVLFIESGRDITAEIA